MAPGQIVLAERMADRRPDPVEHTERRGSRRARPNRRTPPSARARATFARRSRRGRLRPCSCRRPSRSCRRASPRGPRTATAGRVVATIPARASRAPPARPSRLRSRARLPPASSSSPGRGAARRAGPRRPIDRPSCACRPSPGRARWSGPRRASTVLEGSSNRATRARRPTRGSDLRTSNECIPVRTLRGAGRSARPTGCITRADARSSSRSLSACGRRRPQPPPPRASPRRPTRRSARSRRSRRRSAAPSG